MKGKGYRYHPCIDCGQPCDKRGIRCHKCCAKLRCKRPEELIARARAYAKYHYPLTKHPCIDCGKPCSDVSKRCQSCHNKFIAHPQQWSNLAKGEHPSNWRGGRYVAQGYVMIYAPDHPNANSSYYVQEHRLVWEKYHNNKILPKSWVVHHLNGIKDDNRIVNLVALPNRKHRLVLAAKAKRIQELEGLLKNQGLLL